MQFVQCVVSVKTCRTNLKMASKPEVSKMGILVLILSLGMVSTLLLMISVSSIPVTVDAAPKSQPIRVAFSVSEKKSSTSSSLSYRKDLNSQLPVAESTLPHAPVVRDLENEEQHDMSTSTPSSESLESQLQSPHVVRKKALVDFDTSVQATDDLLHSLEMVQ